MNTSDDPKSDKDSLDSFATHIKSIAKQKTQEAGQPMVYDINRGWIPRPPTLEEASMPYTYEELKKIPPDRKLIMLQILVKHRIERIERLGIFFLIFCISGAILIPIFSPHEIAFLGAFLSLISFLGFLRQLFKSHGLNSYNQGYTEAQKGKPYTGANFNVVIKH
jgi:hypothetical protein